MCNGVCTKKKKKAAEDFCLVLYRICIFQPIYMCVVSFEKDCRRKQKLMCQQYGVMDDMLKLLAGLESAEQFLNEPCPPKPGERDCFGSWMSLLS